MHNLTRLLKTCPSTFKAVAGLLVSGHHAFVLRLPSLTRLMSCLTKLSEWRKATFVFDALPLLGMVPDTMATNAAIAAWARGGDWERALELFDGMEAQGLCHDVVTYSSTIFALSHGADWRRSLEVFLRMRGRGIEADGIVWHSLIAAMGAAGKWQLCERIFLSMYQDHAAFRGLLDIDSPQEGSLSEEDAHILTCLRPHLPVSGALGSSAPTPETSSAIGNLGLSTSFITAGRLHHSRDADVGPSNASPFFLAQQPQGQVSLGSTSLSWSTCSAAGDEAFRNSLPACLDDAIAPRSPCLGSLRHHSDRLKQNEVLSARAQMQSDALDASLELDVDGHKTARPAEGCLDSTTAPASASGSSWKTSCSDAPRGHKRGVQGGPSFLRVRCNALLTAYAQCEPAQSERGMALLLVMLTAGGEVEPDAISMHAVVRAYARAGQPSEAFHVYNMLLKQGLKPLLTTMGELMSCAASAGMAGDVEHLWADLERINMAPDIACVNSYMLALLQQGRFEEAMHKYGSLLQRSSPIAADADTMHLIMSELLTRGQMLAVINVHRTLTSLGVSSRRSLFPATITNLLLEAHGGLGHWREAHSVLMAAAKGHRLDSAGLLLVQKQLREVLHKTTDTSCAGLIASVLGLQSEAIVAYLEAGLLLTAEVVEAAAGTCSMPLQTEDAERLQADTLALVFLTSLDAGVPLTRSCVVFILTACSNPGQQSLARRICYEGAKRLQGGSVSTTHAAAVTALCAMNSDIEGFRLLLKLSAGTEAPSPSQLPGLVPSRAFSETVAQAAQALWDVSRQRLALDLLQGIWGSVSDEEACSCKAVVTGALDAARGSLSMATANFTAANDTSRLTDSALRALTSTQAGGGALLSEALCTATLCVTGTLPDPSGASELVHVLVYMVHQRTGACFQGPACLGTSLLPALIELGQVPIAATTLLHAMLARAAPELDTTDGCAATRTLAQDSQVSEPLADALYRTCDALVAGGALTTATALLFVGHRRGVLRQYEAGAQRVDGLPGCPTPLPGIISRISNDLALDVAGLSPGITVALVYAWLADVALCPRRLVAADTRASVLLRGRHDEPGVMRARLPCVLSALGFQNDVGSPLPLATLHLSSAASWILDNTRVIIGARDLMAWLAELQASDPVFNALLATCQPFLRRDPRAAELDNAVSDQDLSGFA